MWPVADSSPALAGMGGWDPDNNHLGRLGHWLKCARISVAVSLVPQRQPHSMRGPTGWPTRCFAPRLNGPGSSVAAGGRLGHWVKCTRISVAVSCWRQRQPQGIRGPAGRPGFRCFGGDGEVSSRNRSAQWRHPPDKHSGQTGYRVCLMVQWGAPQQTQGRTSSEDVSTNFRVIELETAPFGGRGLLSGGSYPKSFQPSRTAW